MEGQKQKKKKKIIMAPVRGYGAVMRGNSYGNKVPWASVWWVKQAELIYELDGPDQQGEDEREFLDIFLNNKSNTYPFFEVLTVEWEKTNRYIVLITMHSNKCVFSMWQSGGETE